MTVVIKTSGGFLVLGLLVVLFVCSKAHSKDLGTLGKTYPIVEEDMLTFIQKTLKKNQQKINEDIGLMKNRMTGFSENPPGINLPRSKQYRMTQITPLFTLDHDITDSEGKIIYKAGTQVNPLRYYPLTKTLCFANGNEKEQVQWIVSKCGTELRNKLILVEGALGEVTKKFRRRFYFDQRGFLSTKLGIQALPAVVRQQGSNLYVEEFPL